MLTRTGHVARYIAAGTNASDENSYLDWAAQVAEFLDKAWDTPTRQQFQAIKDDQWQRERVRKIGMLRALHALDSERASEKSATVADSRKVFVVHGRNLRLRDAMFEFLRSLGLSPIEWLEAIKMTGQAAPYVGQILDAAFGVAQAVVVLFTGDDEAKLRSDFVSESDPAYESQLTPQARPNVLFEAGMALGASQDRTILVTIGNLRPFSDIAGRQAVRLDNSPEKRQELAERLRIAKCAVDTGGTDWLKSGDFEVS